MNTLQKDIQIITALGGPSKVAELLHLPKKGGQQRVQNWLARGIPAMVKVERPDLFFPELMRMQTDSTANHPQTPTPQAPDLSTTELDAAGLVDRRETVRRTDDIPKDAELQALKAGKGATHG